MLWQAHFLILLGELEAAHHLRQQAGDLLSQLEAQGGRQGKLKVELMESFAAQAIANRNDLHLDCTEINAWGGMLATGHPIGASGAVLAARLCHRLEPGDSGLAVIPAAGGLASGLFARCHPNPLA